MSLLKESGDVRSVTKFVLFTTSSDPSCHPYCGINEEYSPLFHI
jgi:hypothetical protein